MKRKFFSVLLALVLVLSFSLVTATPAAAATHTVGTGKTHSTITAAITAASAGDTITVYAGTYSGEASWPIDVNKANLTIQSDAGALTTIIAPGASGQGVIAISADNVTIDGFTINGGSLAHTASVPQEHAIWVAKNYATIKNNTILNHRGNQAGIYIGDRQADMPTATAVYGYIPETPANSRLGHTIQDNTFRQVDSGEGWGIFAYELSDSLIHGNIFLGDSDDYTNGWAADEGAPGTGIIIHKATAGTGVTRSPGGGSVIIEDNTARYVKYSWLTFSAAYQYVDAIGGGYEQPENSTVNKVIVRNNTVQGVGTAIVFSGAKKTSAYGDKFADLTVGTDNVTIGPGNAIFNNGDGIRIDAPKLYSGSDYGSVVVADTIIINNNDIYTNTLDTSTDWWGTPDGYGVRNLTSALDSGPDTVDAEDNWWGDASGPEHSGNTFNSGSQGDKVTDNVDYVPWLDAVYATGSTFAPVKNTSDTPDTGFSSIQAAIDAATTVAGEIITCEAGSYNGTGESFPIDISKGVTLKSVSGAATTIIDGGSSQAIAIATGDVTLGATGYGFTIKGAGTGTVTTNAGATAGITIQGNILRHPTAGEGNGIYVNEATAMTIDNNSFYGDAAWTTNSVEGAAGNGIQVAKTTKTSGTSLTVSNNTAYYIKYCFLTLKTTIQGVVVTGNTAHDIRGFGVCVSDDDGAVTVNDQGLTIRQNTFYNNGNGIEIESTVTGQANIVINYNDIYDSTNTDWSRENYGVNNESSTSVDAQYNYWGDPSGPTIAANHRGAGDAMDATLVDYEPWLHTTQATVYPSGVRYYAYNWCDLTKGWNIWSTPIALDAQADTWLEYKTLGNDLDLASGSNVYYFTSSGLWATPGDNYSLTPCDALYIKMASDNTSPILFSSSTSVPSKTLVAGWNLVSASYINSMNSPVINTGEDPQTVLASVYNVAGANNLGYSQVVSPAVNQGTAWSGVRLQNIDSEVGQQVSGTDTGMLPCKGYWVYMTNAGTLAGTVFTPVSPLQ